MIRALFIGYLTILLFTSCNSNPCEFSSKGKYERPDVALFNHVKTHDYCVRYTYLVLYKNPNGQISLEPAGYYELSKGEYDDMRQYDNLSSYENANSFFPEYHSY